jgi:hypothetical protein
MIQMSATSELFLYQKKNTCNMILYAVIHDEEEQEGHTKVAVMNLLHLHLKAHSWCDESTAVLLVYWSLWRCVRHESKEFWAYQDSDLLPAEVEPDGLEHYNYYLTMEQTTATVLLLL